MRFHHVCSKTKLRSRLWFFSTTYASERGLWGGAKFRPLYQKLLMGKIGVFVTLLVSKLWKTKIVKIGTIPVFFLALLGLAELVNFTCFMKKFVGLQRKRLLSFLIILKRITSWHNCQTTLVLWLSKEQCSVREWRRAGFSLYVSWSRKQGHGKQG